MRAIARATYPPVIAAQRVSLGQITDNAPVACILDDCEHFGRRPNEKIERLPDRLPGREEMRCSMGHTRRRQRGFAAGLRCGGMRFHNVDIA